MKITINKKTFILLIGIVTLTSATVVPIVLFSKKNENKITEKDTVTYANKLKKLSTKEVTISATSGDITTNKNAILNAIKKLTNFPEVPSGINLEVKDDSTNLSLLGVPIVLIVKKEDETNIEITGFKAKRSQSNQEKYVDKLKSFSLKNVTINVTSGDITANKNDILNAIKALDNFPKVPSGISLEVKDDATILNEQWAQVTLIVKKQGKTDLEVTGFKVKRSQSDQEIVDAYFNKLNILPTKEVTIIASSGDVNANKNAILNAIKALDDFPITPSGINLEVKNNNNELTLQGTPVSLVIKKGTITREISGFIAKRSLSTQEEYANKLKALSTKEVTISASSGDITTNKTAILNAIKALDDFPIAPSGISLEVKNDSTSLTLAGVAITLIVKKQNETDLEVSGFTAKRSQTNQEIANDYKNRLWTVFSVYSGPIRSPRNMKIDSESGTLEENKNIIINTIKNSYEFIFPPAGFDIRLKANQTEAITLVGISVDIEIFKIDTQNTLALIENLLFVQRSQTESEIENSNYESIKNHFSKNKNKNIGIPFESPSKTYTSLTQEKVLEVVKKALVFNDSIFWTKTLLDKIDLKNSNQNRAINNFDSTKTITIEYGPNDDRSEVNLQISKYSIKETITKYFEYKTNEFIGIPFNVANSYQARTILKNIKKVLLHRNNELWKTLKNYLFVSSTNTLTQLEKGDFAKPFWISYGPPRDEDINRKHKDLRLKHFSIAQQIDNYFYDEKNRMIDIDSINSSLDLNTADKILEKIKVYLNIKDSSIWTKELQDNLRISPSNKMTSLVKGDFAKPFIIEYTNGSSIETIILKVKHL